MNIFWYGLFHLFMKIVVVHTRLLYCEHDDCSLFLLSPTNILLLQKTLIYHMCSSLQLKVTTRLLLEINDTENWYSFAENIINCVKISNNQKNNLLKNYFKVLYLGIYIFCCFILPLHLIYLINSVTRFRLFSVYRLLIVTCCQSDGVVGGTLCERKLHHSQTF